ncbi:DUF6328 family protein [Aeromicrobium piscarium]|uniref:Sodium:proton antiporter n=1 Tax=Aeromicrobium piscarium TaxID=2590901 RepID=A0A554SA06_9ACTN|nr:DUF6328 family protein [Aeromicrobium piscarium]TSD63142.1 hypothetical protein FNM00_09470 [Aeromicrobium piscarium]
MSGSTAPGTPRGALLDRNWNELLQELRVAQTGVQILTAFLLTVPFSAAFETLTHERRIVYVGVLVSAMTSMLLLMTPVALHRRLFHRGERPWLVAAANRLSLVGLGLLAVANVGAAWLVVDVVLGTAEAFVVAGLMGLLALVLWWAMPMLTRRSHRE